MTKEYNVNTPIIGTDGKTVGDFWQWAYSDILGNRNRGIFAEYIVATALAADSGTRIEWDGWDCSYCGKSIEVKSAAYLQSWKQEKLSHINFDIGRKRSWYAETNTYADTADRPAFCYIFSLLTTKDRNVIDVLDMKQWVFYILKTSEINSRFNNQKTVSLPVLQKHCQPVGYGEVKHSIDQLMRTNDA